MTAAVIRIGNSKGIRIPKPILEQCALKDTVEIEVRNGTLLIRPIRSPRKGWRESFERMAQKGDDRLLDAETAGPTDWEAADWQW